ncbi:MAG: hypothetical protein ACXVZR_10160 [Terriglobales bacterium]
MPTATTPPSSGSTSSASPVGTPAVVQVSAGQAASAVNISVPAPSGTQPNALDLGVANLTGPASAFNTGDAIHRGATMRVVMFGPGLTGDMQVTVLGPNDIQIGNVQAITATDNTPGIAFTVAVTGNAALGARTVVLQTTGGNMTAFTGGLEVVP